MWWLCGVYLIWLQTERIDTRLGTVSSVLSDRLGEEVIGNSPCRAEPACVWRNSRSISVAYQ